MAGKEAPNLDCGCCFPVGDVGNKLPLLAKCSGFLEIGSGAAEKVAGFMLVLRQLGNGSGIGFQLLACIGELRAQKRDFVV